MDPSSISPASQPPRAKKVRSACERCRDRRIKCDGQIPACGNCSKAKTSCIDVDNRAAAGRVSRASQANLYARIEWLENIIKTRLPDVDISEALSPDVQDLQPQNDANRGTKRRREASTLEGEDETSVANKARLMALNLGLLALNGNGSQVHYVGSSSGSFFASYLSNEAHGSLNDPTNISGAGDYSHLEETDQDSEEHDTDEKAEKAEKAEMTKVLYNTLRTELPPKTECRQMANEFFSYWAADCPILHRPSFLVMIDGLYHVAATSGDPHLQHNGWPAGLAAFDYNGESLHIDNKTCIPLSVHAAASQLFYILSIAAQLQIRRRRFVNNPARYYQQALKLSQSSIGEVSVTSLQTILLHVLHSFLSPDGGSTWISLHMAMAFSIDLGLHRDLRPSPRFSKTAVQMRRRIFFSTYALDRWVSTVQGRPVGFDDSGLDMSFASLEESLVVPGSEPEDEVFLPYSIMHFRWSQILSLIKNRFYRFPESGGPSVDTKALQAEINTSLDTWLAQALRVVETLPQRFRLRLNIKTRVNHHAARCLLYQPSQVCVRPGVEEIRICFQSAVQRLRLFGTLYDQGFLPMAWPTMHGVFMAGATLIYCIWYSSEIRNSVSMAVLAKDFRLCSSLLTAGGEWWPLVRRGKSSFERLADYTLRTMTDTQPTKTTDQTQLGPPFPDQDLAESIGAPSAEIEQILQSVLQYDMQLPDMIDTFESTPFTDSSMTWGPSEFLMGGEFGTSVDDLFAFGLADGSVVPSSNGQ